MSDEALFSDQWHRVRDLKPALVKDLHVVQQRFRGQSSHLLHRPSTQSYHRLDSLGYDLAVRLDGQTSVGDLWHAAHERYAERAPTQPEFLALLSGLHASDLLLIDQKMDVEALFQRQRAHQHKERQRRLSSPLYLRFRLGDPDALLSRLSPHVTWLLSPVSGWLYGLLMILAAVVALPQSAALIEQIRGIDALAPWHLGAGLVIYTLMKLVHELGHALLIKHYGGEVRECGIALLVLFPNPYVDASAATLFPGKAQRMRVSAAGIVVETAIAALALILWANSTGAVQELALITVMIGGVSTVLFNANPLLKFDGYYLLSDALEIPNLAERARRHLLGKLSSRWLGLADRARPASDPAEACWLWLYAIGSSVYRVVLMIGIAIVLAGQYFFLGALLAVYALIMTFALPLFRYIRFLAHQPLAVRLRGGALTTGVSVAVLASAWLLPVPQTTFAHAVVWLPDEALVRTAAACEITRLLVEPGTVVTIDQPLLECIDVETALEHQQAEARVRRLAARMHGLAITDPGAWQTLQAERVVAEAERTEIERRLNQQTLVSKAPGRFVIDNPHSLIGQYLPQGALVGYLLNPGSRTLRVALTQAQMGPVQRDTTDVQVALPNAANGEAFFHSQVVRQTPQASRTVVSPALTDSGGGLLRAEHTADGIRLAESAFDLELSWPDTAPPARPGSRAYVKFVHDPAPVADRVARQVRRFLAEAARS